MTNFQILDFYRQKGNFIGRDFITAPEISSLFSEMIAIWILTQLQSKQITKFLLLELGAGNGTMMKDILYTINDICPEVLPNISIAIYDLSPQLVQVQQSTLGSLSFHVNIIWSDSLKQISNLIEQSPSTIVMGNEFLDCLEVMQLIMQANSWKFQDTQTGQLNNYSELKINMHYKDFVDQYLLKHTNCTDGSIIEIPTGALDLFATLYKCEDKTHVSKHTHDSAKAPKNISSGLFFDYGYYLAPEYRLKTQYCSTKETIQLHTANVPINAGVDISYHVDFHCIMSYLNYIGLSSVISTQADFLKSMGLDLRVADLCRRNPLEQTKILQGYKKLVHEMSPTFKVLHW